jgi:hypothetical protein
MRDEFVRRSGGNVARRRKLVGFVVSFRAIPTFRIAPIGGSPLQL